MSQNINDIKLDTIDFAWIKQTTKINHLKRAIRLIEQDGNFFTDLKDACYQRMQQIDPALKRLQVDNRISEDMRANLNAELDAWELELGKKQNQEKKQIQQNGGQSNLEDYQSYFNNDVEGLSGKRKAELAQKERTKGNEAIRSKDYDEAISYYSRSIELDPKMHISYANRALAYLKKKQFSKCLQDSQRSIALCPSYVKAYNRKAKALVGLKRKVQAYRVYKEMMKLQPQNRQINQQMMQLREEMNESEVQQLGSSLVPKEQFKKITIQEDSQEEEQIKE